MARREIGVFECQVWQRQSIWWSALLTLFIFRVRVQALQDSIPHHYWTSSSVLNAGHAIQIFSLVVFNTLCDWWPLCVLSTSWVNFCLHSFSLCCCYPIAFTIWCVTQLPFPWCVSLLPCCLLLLCCPKGVLFITKETVCHSWQMHLTCALCTSAGVRHLIASGRLLPPPIIHSIIQNGVFQHLSIIEFVSDSRDFARCIDFLLFLLHVQNHEQFGCGRFFWHLTGKASDSPG
jgi:hypothetical protein